MEYEKKLKLSGILHVLWCVAAVIYFVMMLLFIKGGVLLPETTGSGTENFGTALGFGITIVLFLLFFAIGGAVGIVECVVHAIVAFRRARGGASGREWWIYLSLFVKSLVVADCLFLTYLLFASLSHLAFGLLLLAVAPLILLAVCELFLFVLDLLIKGAKEQAHADEV